MVAKTAKYQAKVIAVLLFLLMVYHTNQACHATCQLCSVDNSLSDCTACDGANFRNFLSGSGPGACVCDIGYIDAADTSLNPVCTASACSYQCVGLCRGTASYCTSCNAASYRVMSGTQCLCDSHYYDDGTNQLCVSCSSKCKQCSISSTNCTDCYTTTQFRTLSSNACPCTPGYFDDTTDICQPCSYKCSTCSGSATACTACAGGVTRSGTPACNCVAKYYDDGTNANCASCHYSCATCTDGVSCATCDSTKKRAYSSATGLCACIARYYNSGTTQLCSTCHATCLTCSGTANTNCLSCNSTAKRTFITATNKCDCMAGFYQTSATTQNCLSCHVTCATCTGGSASTNCVTCDSTLHRSFSSNSCPCVAGYYNSGTNICVACDSSCATCSSISVCTTCPYATQVIVSGKCTCASGKYFDSVSSACITCSSTCITCSVIGTNCTSCDISTQKRILSGNTCVCTTGYKDTGVTNCAACSYTCLTCDTTGCLTCNATARRTKSGTSCVCSQGFYDDGTNMLCKACTATCLTCSTSASNCGSCDSSTKFRTLSGTSCACLSGYFDPNTGSSVCSKCSNRCATCTTSATNCVTCAGTLSTRTAVPNCLCNSGYYDDGSSADCVACHYSCKTCSNGLTCLTCDVTKKRIISLTTSRCACDVRYYDDGTNVQCATCHQTCYTCSGPTNTNCLTCNSASQRVFDTTTSKCLCKSKYYQTAATTQLCSACHATCLTCSDATVTGCLTCSSAEQRVTDGAGKCICNNGFYLDSTSVCQSCHYTCATCTNASPCITCPYATQVVSAATGICQCSATTAWDSSTSSCISCHYSCTTCIGSITVCATCDTSTNFRAKNGTNCVCLAGYYDNSVAICAACSYQCATCDISGCISCNSNSHRTKSGVTCPCDQGYFDDGLNSMCVNCQYSCKSCTVATACVTCNALLFREADATTNFCKCQILFYEDLASLTCQPCLYHCASCSVADRCITCDSATNHRFLNTTTTLCACENRYYDDGANVLCQSCLYDCLTCTDSSSCTSCDLATDLRVLDAATSRCLCTTRYYEDTSVNPAICAACSYTCVTCISGTSCVTCNDTAYRVKNVVSGQCQCMPGYYDDGSNQLCKPCHYSCATCVDGTTCATCDSGTLRTVVTVCDCPINYYDDGSTKVCHACQYSCDTCISTISCLTCQATTHFRTPDTITPYCKCLDGYYDDGYSNQLCLQCPYQCLTCDNPSTCLTCSTGVNKRIRPDLKCICIDGYYDDGANHALCATCQYTCKTCVLGTQCLLCNALKFRQFDSGTRLCVCMAGYYDTGASIELCQPCSYTCKTCSLSNTHCTTCQATNFRTLSATNSCPCNTYYYDDLINPLCLPCHYSCLTCTDSLTCSSCDATIHREADPTNDRCKCSIRYYDDGNNNRICNSCQATCLTCIDASACTSCDTAALRLLNGTADYAGTVSQFCVCQYKYYPAANPQSACLPCHYSCAVCDGAAANKCKHCSTDGHRVFKSATKTCQCVDGYFDGGSLETCLPCHSWCAKCTTAASTTCTACTANYFLKLDVTSCFSTCPNYFYGKTATMTCQACSSHCITCTSATVCTLCDVGFPLYQNACVNPCPAQSTFLDTPNNVCIDCPTGCLTCNSLIYCTSCVTNYYLDTMLNLCFPCNQYCKGCTGPAQNQCIDCNYPLYLNGTQCYNITCPYGKYIDSHQGCLQCKSLFTNSLTCTITKATLCQKLYKVKNGVCAYCTSVPGYAITATGDCSQVCGDGVLIDYQCDDANNLDGDGCSSNCLVEKGWNCQVVSGRSVCALDGAISMAFNKAIKYGGENKIKLYLTLSVPIRLNGRFFRLVFSNLSDPNSIQWQFYQKQTNLSDIQFTIKYSQNIDKKPFSLSYDTSRRLLLSSRRLLPSITLTFTQTFTLESYPPANYYTPTQLTQLSSLKNTIYISCIILLILCVINLLFPRKMYMHIVVSVCMPAQMLILYGLAAENYTDWVKWSLDSGMGVGFVGGFKVGNTVDLETSQHFGYSVQVTKNMGYVGVIIIGLWVIYTFFVFCRRYCSNMSHSFNKICMYFRYLILTLQICALPHLTYSSVNALYNSSLTSQTSSINVCIAIFINIYIAGLIVALFWGTKGLKPNQLMLRAQEKVQQSMQENVSVNLRPKSRELTETKNDFFMDTYSREDKETQKMEMESSRSQFAINSGSGKKLVEGSVNGDIKQHDGLGYYYDHVQIYKKVEQSYLSQWLIYDYAELYATAGYKQTPKVSPESLLQPPPQSPQLSPHKYSNTKYHLPLLCLKLYLFSLTASVVQSQPFILYIILCTISLAYILYLLIVRPFKFAYSNFRLILTEICYLVISGVMCYYMFGVKFGWQYQSIVEKIVVGLICTVLVFGIFGLVGETLGAWRMEIWNKLEPCLVALRLRGARKVMEYRRPRPKLKIQEQPKIQIKKQQEKEQQMQAFFSRMLQKEALEKQYRRQRMMKNPKPGSI